MAKKYRNAAVVLLAAVAAVAAVWLYRAVATSHVEIGADGDISVTPTQIKSIKAIGEWEFLSVSDEELVDTVRKGLLGDDQLVRIYYGTLRLGVDMHDAEPGWIAASGDSITLTLPRVRLLEKDFIDEARTKSFYESGRWSAADREALYRKAHRQMLAHCLTPANLKTAEENAETQFRRMMLALGYEHITIRFK